MASGEEYQGEGLAFPRTMAAPGPADNTLESSQHAQLQLATVEIAPSRQQTSFDMAGGLDIAKLIQSIDD